MTHFIVGPVETYPQVQDTYKKEHPYFRTQEFGNVVIDCMNRVQNMLGNTSDGKTIYLAASGTGAMDAVVDNCMGENDNALVINGGSFGHRFCDLLKWYNISFDSIDLEWNEVVTADDLTPYENKGYTALFVNLDETSSGKLYDIELLSDFAKRNNMYLIVDAISTFLADEYNMAKYGIDVTIISSQKGLCLSPGMSIISFSKSMVDKINSNDLPQSYYFNFRDYFNNMERGQTPYTSTVSIIWELKAMLDLIDEKGGVNEWIKSIKDKAEYFRAKAKELGLTVPDYPKSNTLTPLYFEDISASDVVVKLREEYGLYINPCGGKMADKLLRVSHIGNITKSDLDNLLDKMALVIKELKTRELITNGN